MVSAESEPNHDDSVFHSLSIKDVPPFPRSGVFQILENFQRGIVKGTLGFQWRNPMLDLVFLEIPLIPVEFDLPHIKRITWEAV